jgi:hypothetical protein
MVHAVRSIWFGGSRRCVADRGGGRRAVVGRSADDVVAAVALPGEAASWGGAWRPRSARQVCSNSCISAGWSQTGVADALGLPLGTGEVAGPARDAEAPHRVVGRRNDEVTTPRSRSCWRWKRSAGSSPIDRARLDALLAEHGLDLQSAPSSALGSQTRPRCWGPVSSRPRSRAGSKRDGPRALADAPTRADGPAKVDGGSAAIAPTHRERNALIAIAAAIVLVAVRRTRRYLAAPRNPVETFIGLAGVQIVPFAPSEGTGAR